MNARAYDLVLQLRAILRSLPGATSIALHASEVWTLALITASSDEAVIALSEGLGLGRTRSERPQGGGDVARARSVTVVHSASW
jgi:hypothetical protein